MSTCNLCSLNTKCANPGIWGKKLGMASSQPIMIVQDYPSFKDDRSDETPTVDTKQKLSYFLRKAGIRERDVYFSSAIKCSVPKPGDIKQKHIDVCRNYLLSEIREIKPKVIIVMGKTAHWMLTDHKSVYEFVGHFSDFDFEYEVENKVTGEVREAKFAARIMPTYGLTASLGKWEYNPEIIRHFKKALEYVQDGTLPRTPDPTLNVILSLDSLKEFRDRMLKTDWVATDLETTGFTFFQDKIINAGYCADGENVDIVFLEEYQREHLDSFKEKEDKLLAIKINRFVRENKKQILATLKEVHQYIKAVLHNGKFDSKFTAFNGIPYKHFHADTLIGDSLVDENNAHGLNHCFERNGIEFGAYDVELFPFVNKDEKKKKSYQWVPPRLINKYLGYDVYGLHKLWVIQEKQIEKAKLIKHFYNRKMPALRMATIAEYNGMKADKKLIVSVSKAIVRKQDETLKTLIQLTEKKGYKPPKGVFNPNSGKQVSDFMVHDGYPLEKLGFPQNATGFSTAAEHMQKLLDKKKYAEFPKLVLDFKKLSKIKGTYVDGKKGEGGMIQYLDPYHRIHTNYNLWTPRTSRWSSNRPSVQVWPRPINGLPNPRSFIIPRTGWNLFEADYRALEMYVVAGLSKDPTLTKLLQDGTDVHSYNSVYLGKQLGIVDKEITYEQFLNNIGKGVIKKETIENDAELKKLYLEFNELRTRAKTIGFGLSYGKGAHSFSEEFGIDQDDAQDMIDAYFDIYVGMKKWRDDIVRRALIYGEVHLPSGRPRRFHAAVDWMNSNEGKQTWNAKKLKDDIARQAMNYPVQGGAHEIFEPGCIRLNRRFKKENMQARVGLYIHDGIVGECPVDENERVAQYINEQMSFTFHEGTKLQLNVGLDIDFYEGCWYGPKKKSS